MKKKMMALLLTLVMATAMGATTAAAEGDAVKIGVSMRETKNPFYKVMSDVLVSKAKEAGYEAVALDANGDIAQQTADLENLMTQNCDIIYVDLIDPDAFAGTVQTLRDAGIDVITINDGVGDTTPVTATVTTDNFGNGLLVGEWLAAQYSETEPIKALCISGEIGNETGLDRRVGMIQGIQEYQLAKYGKTNFEVVYQIYCDGWNVEVVNEKFEDVAQTLDFNCIISESDVLTQYCLDSLNNLGLRDKVLLASAADGEKSCLKMIETGELDVTAMNSPSLIAEKAFEIGESILAGEAVTGYYYTNAVLVDKDNVAENYDPDSLF